MAANLRDEHGNPIQLTDEHGNPVKLTDEHGNPIQLSGVAYTSSDQGMGGGAGTAAYGGQGQTQPGMGGGAGTTLGSTFQSPHGEVGGMGEGHHTIGEMLHAAGGGGDEAGFGEGGQYQPRRVEQTEEVVVTGSALGDIQRGDASPSSSSSEGDMHTVEGEVEGGRRRKKKGFTEKIKEKLTGAGKHKDKDKDIRHTMTTTVTSTTKTSVEHHEDEGKKSMLEKIKDKLPGTGHTSTTH